MPSLLSTTTEGPPYSWHHSRQNSHRALMKLFCSCIWLRWVVAVAHGVSVAPCRPSAAGHWLSSCAAWAQWLHHVGLAALRHVGSYSPDQKSNTCSLHFKAGAYPLDFQASPSFIYLTFDLYLIILGLIILKIGHISISPTQYRKLRQRATHTSFPRTCFSRTGSESSPSAWAPCSAELLGLLHRDNCTHSQSVRVFSAHKPQAFLTPPWIQEALLGIWWGRKGIEDWTVDQWLLIPVWFSASKMSTALPIIMHFTGCFLQKARRNIPRRSRTSVTSWMKRVSCWPHNKTHSIIDPDEGTVEFFTSSWLKNNYCSVFSASYLRKAEIINVFFFNFMCSNWNLLYQLVLF